MAKNDRLRVPIDDEYLTAVGLAAICFARLEWDAVWCCEKIQKGYLNSVARKTASTIAKDLVRLAAGHPRPDVVQSLEAPGKEFQRLVQRRNDLVHSNPATAKDKDNEKAQRLVRTGKVWTIEDVNNLADEFTAASAPLNNHIHKIL